MQHRRSRLMVEAGLGAALVVVSVASAQAQATNHLWTVPGVVDNGLVKTAFACTNNGTSAADVAVEVFDRTSASVGSATLPLGPGESRLWETSTLSNFIADATVGVPGSGVGYAQILSSAKSKINCSAWLARSDSMATLTVAKKTKQKGD